MQTKKQLECSARWRSKNKERIKQNNRKWRAANPRYNEEWKSNNPQYSKAWRSSNPLYNKDWNEDHPLYRKAFYLRSMYGISSDQFKEMLTKQNWCCAICSQEFTSTKQTHIDHCHNTNVVRGILCRGCNMGLGHFYDNKATLGNAIKYLEKCRRQQ